jgi:hypothetical protein
MRADILTILFSSTVMPPDEVETADIVFLKLLQYSQVRMHS